MISSHSFARLNRRNLPPMALLVLFLVSLFVGVSGASAAPTPSVPSLGNQDVFIGDPASFSFNFSNTGPNTGYGPFIELTVDTSGPDGASSLPLDGYGTPTVTVAGLSLSPTDTFTLVGNDTLYVYALPFGSFTPGQTTLTTITIPTSNLADLDSPLSIAVTPGFRDDTPKLDGPAIYGATSTGTITPKLYHLNKIYVGPEDETATGPNFPRHYQLKVDVATGQSVSNLVVTDDLAKSMQITGIDATHMSASTSAGGSFNAANVGGTATPAAPDGTLTYNFGSLTGVDGVDAVFDFEFYIPRDDASSAQVVPQTPLASPTTGTDSTLATNTADSRLDWTPIDTRDPLQTNLPPATSGSTLTHKLEQQSLAIQKSAAVLDTAGTIPPNTTIIPGKTIIKYTLDFQLSDYYAVQNIAINDVLGDGIRLFTGTRGTVTASVPTLSVKNAYLTGSPGSRTDLAASPFGGGNIAYERRYNLESALPPGTSSDPTSFPGAGPANPAFVSTVGGTINGSTLLHFDVSAELKRRLGATAGRLVGGEINNDGSGPENDPFAGPNLGGTTGQIVFYAEVSQDFSDDFPSSDRSVDQGDLLNNSVNDPLTAGRDGIIADQIRPSEINDVAPTVIGTATDDSGTSNEIGYGEQSKTINRINGKPVPTQAFFNPPFSVQPGDRITYKLTYSLPINSYEQLRITDFPPLPVMQVGAETQYSFEGNLPTYGSYTVAIAPDDTFFGMVGFIGPTVQAATTVDLGVGAIFNPTGGTAGNGAFTVAPLTVDGVTLVAGNKVLVKDQADPRQNGVYLIVSDGNWERDTSMDLEGEVESSRLVRAAGGSVNTGIDFVQTNNEFTQFNIAGARGNIVFERFISTDQPNNGILLNFGNYDESARRLGVVSLLITLPVGNDPFGKGLFLTNQMRVNEASTNNGKTTVEEVRRFELVRPVLTIQKGVVGANITGFTLGGISFNAPSTPSDFSGGPINTAAQANAIGAKNIGLSDTVDAGDKIRYAIVAQNTDKGDAYDVVITDTIPIEYNRATFNPTTDLVLRHGDGTLLNPFPVAVNGFVRLATSADVGGTFSAAVPSNGQFTNAPRQISGIAVDLNDRVLVKDQATASQNGIYEVTAIDLETNTITLDRATDADTAAKLNGYAGGLPTIKGVAVANPSAGNDHYLASAIATLNADPVNWVTLPVADYYTSYIPATGKLQILLSDNYSAGNVGDPSWDVTTEDNRTGAISRGLRTDQLAGDKPITNGSNTIVATYDVTLQNTATPNQKITNIAAITTYSNNDGGQDLTNPDIIAKATDPKDSADVIIKLPLMNKTLVSTEVTAPGNNAATQAAIGELATYKVTLTVPEGTSPNAIITDTLDNGLAFVDITDVQLSSASLSSSTGLTFANNGANNAATQSANTGVAAVSSQNGRQIAFNLAAITNNDTDNTVAETITITYRAIVLNTNAVAVVGSANNQSGQTRNNSAKLGWKANGTTIAAVSSGRTTGIDGTASGTTTPLTIVEPTLTNLKDIRNVTQSELFPVAPGTPQSTRADAGDDMEYRITIANAASGSTTAFDATLSDQLPFAYFTGGFSVVPVTGVTTTGTGKVYRDGLVHTLVPGDFTISGAGLLELDPAHNYDIEPDVTITLLISATDFTGATGKLVDNTADLRWTSMDGTFGAPRSTYDTSSTERNGADGEIGTANTLNDYRDTDNAEIESPPIVRKTIVVTSEPSTSGANAAVGEIVRFRLVASVAEGTAGNFQIRDFLPVGFAFINDGTARWALVSTNGNAIASTTVSGIPSLGAAIAPGSGGIDGNQLTISGIASSSIIGTFADANISTDANNVGTGEPAGVYPDGAPIFFRFGTLANTDNDTNVEYAVVEFNALVRNLVSNQAGTALDNRMTILADTNNDGTAGYIDVVTDTNGDGVGNGETTVVATDPLNDATGTPAQSAPTTVTVVEPNLQINKQVIATNGAVVTYRVTLTNPVATNATDGFNLHVLDNLNVVNFSRTSLAAPTITLAGGAAGATDISAGNTIDITIDTLPVGGSVVIEYQANVLVTPTGAAALSNTATATYTSLPGDYGTGGTWAGTTFPDVPGSANGERTGVEGIGGMLNNYAVADTERIGSIGNRVYFDADGNGVQNPDTTLEPGIVGVPVTVRWAGTDGTFGNIDDSVITVITGANGIWTVNALPIGTVITGQYRVSAPAAFSGMALTDVRDNGGAANTNPNGIGVGISAVTLTGTNAGNTNPTNQDFGYRGTASLGNRIYIDANGDGVQDANGLEPSLPSVVTTVTWAGPDNDFATLADNLTFTQNSTNAATNYLYSNLPLGDFRVAVSPTGGTGGVPDNTTLTDALDNGVVNTNPDGLGAGIVQTTLTNLENETTIDFGYRGTASIGNYVWYDVDGDGVQDANEPGIPGATVTLVWGGPNGTIGTGGDDVTFTTTTDASGMYLFPSLPVNGVSDPYQVTVTPPAAYPTQTFDADGIGTVNNSTLNLAPTEDNVAQDFGYRGTAQLGDLVWQDTNGNGRQDGEPGINGVSVSLFFDSNNDGDFADTGEGTAIATTPTAGGGLYSFTNLAAGNYQVLFGNTAGATTYTRTVANSAVATNASNSDADVATGRTGTYTLINGQNDATVDSGLYIPVSLGDRVFYDVNGDGLQPGDLGISGVAITVVWLGPNGVLGGGDDISYPTTTGANGIWSVTNLPPGNFRVTSGTPPNGLTTLTDSFDNSILSATNPVTPNTTSGVNRTDIDFGFRGTATLGDFVWNDRNSDGVQNANEPGIPNVTVTLTWFGQDGALGGGDDVSYTTTTNSAGAYTFTNLPSGNFRVAVNPATLPNVTATYDLDSGTISPDGTADTTLTTGQNRTDVDFGYVGDARVGDTVWYDANGDGTQGAGEPGIAGVTVTLLFGGNDGNLASAIDNITYTTVTDANGKYLFSGIPGGDFLNGTATNYRVTVTQPAAYPTQTYDATAPTTDNISELRLAAAETNLLQDFGYRGSASLGNFVWEDLNGNGRQDGAGEPGIDGVTVDLYYDSNNDGDFLDTGESTALATTITAGGGAYSFPNLTAGNYQVVFGNKVGYTRTVANSAVATNTSNSDADVTTGRTGTYTLTIGQNDLTVDAGLYKLISLGDRVYYDLNGNGVQDAGDLGISGVSITVVWLGPDGVLGGGDDISYPTTTGANGIWSVTNLPPGSFEVTSSTLPSGVALTDSIDNGGAASATNPVTISTDSGVDRTDIDFGYRGVGSIGDRVFLDINNNGSYDAGEGIDGVTVTLVGDLNGDGTDDTLTTTTASDGFYQFNNLRTTAVGLAYTVTVNTAQIPQDGAGAPLPNTVDPDGGVSNISKLKLASAAPSNQLQDFGYRGLGQIGDTIFLDANSNDLPDAGEGITGVGVILSGDIDGDGTAETFTTATNASGIYDFSNLPVRDPNGVLINYTVTVDTATLPSSLTNTVDPDTANPGDNTSALTLPTVGAPQNLAQDFGYRGTGAIGDRIFLDVNNNSTYDSGEGIANVTVTLTADLNGDGISETLSTTTDADGFYQFSNLPIFRSDGTTAVNYTVAVTTATLPTGVTNTVDPDGGLNNTSALALSLAAATDQAQDFGYRGTASLGDRVWLDANNNGNQDAVAQEPGMPGISMQLTWAGQDNTFGNGDDITSASVTDSNGAYTFSGLPPGTFRVNAVPSGLASNLTQTYDLDGLASANQSDRVLALAETATDVDFGYHSNASVGDRVWLDQDSDGVQDPSEVGLAGVTIQITWYGSDGIFGTTDDVVFITTTGVNGAYLVDGLPANALVGANPNYNVKVTGLPITGLSLSDSLDDGALNAVNPIDIQVSPIDGDPLNDRRDVDFGYDGASTLAGTVYRDDNNNGVLEAGEPLIANVTLTLTGVDVFGNPYFNPTTGQPYQVTTNASGAYIFDTVVPGTYTITESQPANYNDGLDTAGNLGGNAGNDVISGILVGANQTGKGYNFGERGPFVAGVVFRDDNHDGALDPTETTRLPNVTIDLYDSSGTTLVKTTTTGPDGSYRFDNIAIGSYQIRETQPTDYVSSPSGPFAPNTRNVNVPAAGLIDQHFGEILGSISGVVYVDANTNGTRNPTDTARIGNVPITLTGTDTNKNVVNVTVFTNPSGAYRFDNLFPANAAGYTITEGSAAPYTDQAANPGTGIGGTLGSAAGANSITGIGLTAGSQGIDYDFGEILPTQTFIAGSVYSDDSRDGIRDTTELAIPGVTITLYDAGADGIFGNGDDGTTTTAPSDSAGNYLFPNLTTGHNYRIVETQPSAYGNSPAGPTVFIAVNNLPATGSINNNFGEVLGSLAGIVYFDANGNGSHDLGEPGIAGTTITLTGTDVDGNPVSGTTTTATDGSYRFDNLPTGNYAVTETQPASYADGGETIGSAGGINSTNDQIDTIPLGAGVNALNYNYGEIGVPVSGIVFYDADRAGDLDVGETPIPSITIRLVDSIGTIVATTTTKPDGSYLFPNVAPGIYTIVEVQPAGYGDPPAGPFAPNNRSIKVLNTAITDQDFGDTLSTLAGNVYVDTNNNGVINVGEIGISGVSIRLDWAGPDGIFGNGDDQIGRAITTTGVNGNYLFTDLPTGVYRVVEPNQPAPYSDGLETPGAQGGNIATNEQISDIPIATGVDLTDYNFGEQPPVNTFISGSVYIDTNNNGTRDPGEPGIPGVTITLTGPSAPFPTTTTDANGNYVFPNLTLGTPYIIGESQPTLYGNGLEVPGNNIPTPVLPSTGLTNQNFGELPGTISGIVYFDADASATLNAGDVRLPGVTVTLLDGTGAAVNNPITGLPYVLITAADGSYLFKNLPAGNYRVAETQPSGYNDGTENPGSGNTSTINDQIDVALLAGGDSPDNNYGELGATISGTVWIDTNRDGALTGETGRIPSVNIRLFDSSGTQVANTPTDASGYYHFDNLPPGSYTIVEDQPNIYGSTTPNGISVTITNTGSANNNFGEVLGSLAGYVYADLNNNGLREAGEPGIPATTITLTGKDLNGNPINQTAITAADGSYKFSDLPSGTYQTDETQPSGFSDGLDQAGTAGGSIITNDTISNIPLGAGVDTTEYDFGEIGVTISGTVWLDRNRDGILDTTEPGVGSVTLELRDNKGTLIRTITTNPDGSYVFVGLAEGVSYTITELQPTLYGSSTPNVITTPVLPSTGLTNQNFGETLGSVSGSVFIDNDDNGIRDPNEKGIPTTTITLTGKDLNGNPVTRTTMTDSNGNYRFNDLPAGTYTVLETQPVDYADGHDTLGNAGGTLINDQSSGIIVTAGGDATGYTFGENPLSPTAVVLASFTASHTVNAVVVQWVTVAERNTWGFQLYCSTTGNREDAQLVTPEQIAATGRGQGASYEWRDTNTEPGVTYTYWLVETEIDGQTVTYGPVRTQDVTPTESKYWVFLPDISR